MKTSAIIIFVLICMSNCMGQKSKERIFKEYDSLGRVIERWGNENTLDNDVNFREFYFYDKSGKLIRKLYYECEDENTECIIADEDSLRYTEFIYIYNKGRLILEQRYDPVLDKDNNVVDHKLTYVYNHILDRTDSTSPTYGK